MTVCISALCVDNHAPAVVFASDRMVQWGPVEFEHTQRKVTLETPHVIAMVSGDALLGTKLTRDIAGALAGTTQPVGNIATALAQGYDTMRRAEIEHQFLHPRGLDFQSYYDRQAHLNGNIVAVLDQAMAQYNPMVDLVIAGIDGSGAHVYTVNSPYGASRLHDMIGYAAVGSGMLHALQSLIGFRHSPEAALPETVFRVYAAKRRAEVAPGVGLDTDMGLITPQGTRWLSDAEKQELRAIYDEHEANTTEALTNRLAQFTFGQMPPVAMTTTVSSGEDEQHGRDDDSEPAEPDTGGHE
jgi:20S proteasome alpha/beta subunit